MAADPITPPSGGNLSPTAPGLTAPASGGNLAPGAPFLATPASGGNLGPGAPGLVQGAFTPETKAFLVLNSLLSEPRIRFEAVVPGTAGNTKTIRFVGTADPNPSGPYPPVSISSIVVAGDAVTVNWSPTQYSLLPSVVKAAMDASGAASALMSTTVLSEGVTTYPGTATALGGGAGAAVPAAIAAASGGNLNPTAPGAIVP